MRVSVSAMSAATRVMVVVAAFAAARLCAHCQVVELESLLASVTVPADQLRDPHSLYHKIDLPGLQALTPDLSWAAYLSALGAPSLVALNVGMPAFFQAANKIIATAAPTALQTYLRWNLLHSTANLLPSAFQNETFAFFGAELSGRTGQYCYCCGSVRH